MQVGHTKPKSFDLGPKQCLSQRTLCPDESAIYSSCHIIPEKVQVLLQIPSGPII